MNNSKRFIGRFLILTVVVSSVLIFAGIFASCKDSVLPPLQDNFDFSYIQSADTTDNINVLVIDTVKILLKDIKLNVSGTSNSSNSKVGPFVLNLNLLATEGVHWIGSNLIPPGTYDKIKFEVHKLNDNEAPPDPEFVDGNGRYSVIVKGYFNYIRFVYKSTKSANQQLAFPNQLQISETKTNVTIKIKPYLWFIDENHAYMSPFDSTNRNKIDNNIKDNINANFTAFKDADFNGVPD